MYFVEVLVGDATYHGNEPLTYSSPHPLTIGALVEAPLRHKVVLGVVVGSGTKPTFSVKPISSIGDLPPLPSALLALLEWLRTYYPAPLGILAQLFLPSALPKQPTPITPFSELPELALPPLTSEQREAIEQTQSPGMSVLHGQTGTGKTRVYVELARKSLESGKSAIILTPEIGLTSQLGQTLRDTFGDRVIVMHSQLSQAVRQRRWQQILEQDEPLIVMGARSALFSPLKKVGLVVVDEAHETAYKQDQAPYYHASLVAGRLAQLHGAPLILGSATPLVTDYYLAEAKGRPIVAMNQLAKASNFTDQSAEVVDLRDRSSFTTSPYLSNQLIKALRTNLGRQEQSLLFLNRRGTARIVFCQNCGWQASCPHCDLPLVYHGDTHVMRCHTCDFHGPSPISCPSCRSASIVFKSIGTKALTSEVERLMPEARLIRFDSDNTKEERMEQQYDAVHRGDFDIIIGTQTLAKGLDLPRLSLVGVVIADTSLYFPDFSAQERTFQLLSQVLGRIGRGHRQGRAIVQTYAPDSTTLHAALNKNWSAFYGAELAERRTFGFPPFCYLLKLSCRRASSVSAQRTAERLAAQLRESHPGISVDGPSPSFHEKVRNKFSWQLVIKAKQRSKLLQIVSELPSGWSYDIDPMNLL